MERMIPDRLPTISVTIASFNGRGLIEECLQSVRAQDYPQDRIEIVVADGGSRDGTRELCKSLGARVIDNPMRTEKRFDGGKSRAIHEARNDVVVLLDQDNVMGNPGYLRDLVRPLWSSESAVAVLPIVTSSPAWPPFQRYAGCVYDPFTYRSALSCEERSLLSASKTAEYILLNCREGEKSYLTNGSAVRRQSLLEIGGYDFDLETGLRIREEGEVWLSTRALLFHRTAESLRELVRKKARQLQEWERDIDLRRGPNGLVNIAYPRDSRALLRLSAHALGNLTVIPALSRAIGDAFARKDVAMLWHVLAAPVVTAEYFVVPWSTKSGRALLREVIEHAVT